jgi:hypothetical protein
MGFPAVNAQEDPSYEQGLTPGSVLPALANCSLDDGELPTLHQIIKIFTDAQVENGGAAYVRDHLAQLPDVTADDRAKLVDGARQDLDTTLRHLVDHSCRLLLQSHFDEGASRDWILHMIEQGQKSDDTLCMAYHPLPRFRFTLAAFFGAPSLLRPRPTFFASADLVFA